MIDSMMMEFTNVQCIIAVICVSVDNAIWLDFMGNFIH